MPRVRATVGRLLPLLWALVCLAGASRGAEDPPLPPAPAPVGAPAVYAVRLDAHAPARKWEGWGVSLSWWANVFGTRDDVADLCFTLRDVPLNGETLPGLGLNIVRYNAGACSANAVNGKTMALPPVSPKAPAFRRLEGFWLDGKSADPASPSWDWSADARQRAMLGKARDRGVNYFELFSNSPMWWMCKNLNPSGALDGGSNLDPARFQDFAVYLATVAQQARAHWGIAFTTVEPFNEPGGSSWKGDGRQEACHLSPAEQRALIPLLRAELDRRGLTQTPIAASDDDFYTRALGTWGSFPPEVKAQVGQYNVHGYQDKATAPRAQVREQTAGKRRWSSEYCADEPAGLRLAGAIGRDLQLLQPTAWCYWQVLDQSG